MRFYNSIADYYQYIFPIGKMKTAFVADSINKLRNVRLLDIGCAAGDLADSLSEFKNITEIEAIDLDERMIEIANSNIINNKIKFQVMDMTCLLNEFGTSSFNTVVCFGNTLVHLQDIDTITCFITDVKKILKSDGIFLLQILNYDYIEDNGINELPVINNNYIHFERKYEKAGKSLSFNTRLTVKETGQIISSSIPLYPLKKAELHTALLKSGFTSIEYFASFDQKPYAGNHLPLVVRAL